VLDGPESHNQFRLHRDGTEYVIRRLFLSCLLGWVLRADQTVFQHTLILLKVGAGVNHNLLVLVK
jgi:hypothetical protein